MKDKIGLRAPIIAGLVASITGTAATVGIFLSAYVNLGASKEQSIAMVSIMLVAYGLLSIVLSWKFKMPLSIVWSTPGAALIAGSTLPDLGFSNAMGGVLIAGLLLALTGLWPALGKLVSKIPKSVASAMLAGVIFSFCVAPFAASATYTALVIPVILVWIVLYWLAPVWASPGAIILAFTLIGFDQGLKVAPSDWLVSVNFVMPTFSLASMLSIGLPLYLVSMASQNIPGIAIMKNYGYEVPFRASLTTTGLGTVAVSFLGGFVMNLAAITAALNANEQAHKDPAKRWLASVSGGIVYCFFAIFAGIAVAFVIQTPTQLLLAASGLALLPTIVSAFSTMVEIPSERIPAVAAFLVASSGVAFFSVGAAFWAILVGLAVMQLLKLKRPFA
ncbi:MAG: benzoate/H(+) symporter BenE family transporter [Acidobacteria bacterium]|nr:benzoate/H(+) symporter BenE family transporter [Acidobacteriota bacterium]